MQNLAGVIFTSFGHFSFYQTAVLNENMTKFTCLLQISGTCCTLSEWTIKTNLNNGVLFGSCLKLPHKKKLVFFADFTLQNMVETTLPHGLETSG